MTKRRTVGYRKRARLERRRRLQDKTAIVKVAAIVGGLAALLVTIVVLTIAVLAGFVS